jgi:hypothetical protein
MDPLCARIFPRGEAAYRGRRRSGRRAAATQEKRLSMKWLKKLDNPFLLVLNGFGLGAILFFATTPERAPEERPPAETELSNRG